VLLRVVAARARPTRRSASTKKGQGSRRVRHCPSRISGRCSWKGSFALTRRFVARSLNGACVCVGVGVSVGVGVGVGVCVERRTTCADADTLFVYLHLRRSTLQTPRMQQRQTNEGRALEDVRVGRFVAACRGASVAQPHALLPMPLPLRPSGHPVGRFSPRPTSSWLRVQRPMAASCG
jgi:hypothetical protein